MKFKQIYDEIVANKHNHEQGYFNCIPFTGMSRLEQYLPGIEQDTYYLLTASSGVGKSKLSRALFMHNPYQYIKTSPESGVKLTVKYFSLEESKKKVILSEISKYLHSVYGIVISIKQLQSRGRFNTISTEIVEKVKEAEEYVEEFLDTVEIIDSIRNPTGIYKHMRNYAMEVGNYYGKNGEAFSEAEKKQVSLGQGEAYKNISYYKKDHDKHYVVVLTDHISLLDTEVSEGQRLTQWQTMGKWSSDYCLRLRDKFGFIPVNVQQQASAKEQVEYNYKGNSIEEKLEPSLEGLGDNKTTQRDANVVLGLFAPDRYNIEQHNGYDVRFFRDRYRSMSILKDRDGIANKKLPLFFDGAVDFFKELPRADDVEGMRKVINYVNQLNKV